LNNLSLSNLIYKQQFNHMFILIPILTIFCNNDQFTINNNIFISTIVESFAASIVEESLFRNLIPNNFKNKNVGIFVAGLLFSIIHIKQNVDTNIIVRIFITSMLFNILCFQYKPNNILFHFIWNFITISLFKYNYIQGTTINNLEISNITIIIFILAIIFNYYNY
ncbi:MAG: CPBP family intramembrane metalloprotease, partial [Mycoplasmataceae bacterium]|nr:CPBP family intramembrane metalloprotease [Mycoplasmataceae bacterium]